MRQAANPPRVILASGNAGKLAELQPLLAGAGLELESLAQHGIDSGPEDAVTFVENALSKARHATVVTGLPALADDSGLLVNALGGAPGVRSARFAGDDDPATRDASNNRLLLERLSGLPAEQRGARFCCVLVLLRSPEDPLPRIAQGIWEGRILEAPRGEGGFGYDPLFLDPALDRAAAELSREQKAARSHRGRAVRALQAELAGFAASLSR